MLIPNYGGKQLLSMVVLEKISRIWKMQWQHLCLRLNDQYGLCGHFCVFYMKFEGVRIDR